MQIAERIQSTPQSVDRDAGVIRGVKLLGLESSNRRRYKPSAIHEAVKLYEDATVNLDHAERADSPREYVEGVGVIRNPIVESDGVYGDLHYLTTHPYGPSIGERAERFPKSFGMSHSVEVDGNRGRDGVFEIDAIKRVHGVDIVSRPATTKGLFESEKMSTYKLSEVAEMWTDGIVGETLAAAARKSPDTVVECGGDDEPVAVALATLLQATFAEARKSGKPQPVDNKADKALESLKQQFTDFRASIEHRWLAEQILEESGAEIRGELIRKLAECEDEDAMREMVEECTPAELNPSRKPRIKSKAPPEDVLEDEAASYASFLKTCGIRGRKAVVEAAR